MKATREAVLTFAEETWGDEPDFPFAEDDVSAVLRHPITRKWYALVMRVGRDRLGLPGEGMVDILNLKADPILAASLLHRQGFLPAYHMNKTQWLTVLLDGTLEMAEVYPLIEMSHTLTDRKVVPRLRC